MASGDGSKFYQSPRPFLVDVSMESGPPGQREHKGTCDASAFFAGMSIVRLNVHACLMQRPRGASRVIHQAEIFPATRKDARERAGAALRLSVPANGFGEIRDGEAGQPFAARLCAPV